MPTQEDVRGRLAAADLDPELSWTEQDLPEHARTKHVHRLHPYLGKFVPQLVEVFLRRHFRPGQRVLDPFAGSGTTLVECSVFGAHSVGVDISAFNVLLAGVKTSRVDLAVLERDAAAVLAGFAAGVGDDPEADAAAASPYLRDWFDPQALAELLAFRAAVRAHPASAPLLQVVLSRAARSARRTYHYHLDFPRRPASGPYWCHKHRRVCEPTREAAKFLRRYTRDALARVGAYVALRSEAEVDVRHADARSVEYGVELDGIVTSPPYPGRIDYHEQHRYAYELLDLPDRTAEEIGTAAGGSSRRAVAAYVDDMAAVLANARRFLPPGAPVVIVVDDARSLYDGILATAGLELVERRKRHVNRRTGRREGDFFEEILLARA